MPRIITTLCDIPVTYEIRDGGTLQEFMLEKYPEQQNFLVPVVAWKNTIKAWWLFRGYTAEI